MSNKLKKIETVKLTKIIGGGQALGELSSGKKVLVWGGLPEETVEILITKSKSSMSEGIVTSVIKPSKFRLEPLDPDSYISTSPWQIMDFEFEQTMKKKLIIEAFEMHRIKLLTVSDIYTDKKIYGYRNKMEYAFWWDKDKSNLDLAFFKRSSHTKIPIQKSSIAMEKISEASIRLRQILRAKHISGSDLKSAIIRTNQNGEVAVQLYTKNPKFELFSNQEINKLAVMQFEIIYSNPKSPASVVTKKIQSIGENLTDNILGKNFSYSTEGFFQVNLPVYEKALIDMQDWILEDFDTLDFYSGVGTIGLNIGQKHTKLVEINQSAYAEMQKNISNLHLDNYEAILSSSEQALDLIKTDSCLIVDPPRAGLHQKLIDKLLEIRPKRILYLSCNPVTQARDIENLLGQYKIVFNKGYNFFPRTPHIEHLVVLDNTIA